MEYLGNKDILKHHKTAFLCSQKCPADVVLKSYDWAKQQRTEGNCIVCSNHSQIEKDVFGILLKGSQPLILVLARSMKTKWENEITKAVSEHRLLVISPVEEKMKRITRETAETKNNTMIKISDQIVVGYITPSGLLHKVLAGIPYRIL